MIESIILAFFAAKLKGYKIKPILKDWPVYFVFVSVLIYILLELAIFNGQYGVVKFVTVYKMIYTASFFGMILNYELYRSTAAAVVLAATGSALNNIAISSNGGKMPVFPKVSYITGYVSPDFFSKVNDIHVLGTSSVSYKYLTDVIDLGYTILSVGDILISMFAFVIIYAAIKHCSRSALAD